MFVDFLGAFGFSDGPLRKALFLSASADPLRSSQDWSRKHLRRSSRSAKKLAALQHSFCAFIAGSDLRMNHAISSTGDFLEQLKAGQHKLQRRFKNRRMFQEKILGQSIHGCRGFDINGSWSYGLLSLGSWFFWTEGAGSHTESKVAMASFGKSSEIYGKSKFTRRLWTNVFIALNVLIFVAQEASHGKLLLLGAKVNSLIDQGQLWRFLTPAFLHANLGHLLTNCYSLNSIGPVIEAQGGSRRFLAVYIGSAIAGFAMSYYFTRAPAVGASGAVFGLVGSLGVFLLRHKHLLSGAQQTLSQTARVIAINLVMGLTIKSIDNWGHLGGLMGGAAISWLLGPAFSYERAPGDGKIVLVDRPPISCLLPKSKRRLS